MTCAKFSIFTARKRSLGQGNMFTGVCLSTGEVLSQHALQQVSRGEWYPSMPCRFPGPKPRGRFRGIWPGGSPGQHPRGKLRGIWSRPTPKGEVEGDLAQGGCLLWGCRDGYCYGRYASYWNAFLFSVFLVAPVSKERSDSYSNYSVCKTGCILVHIYKPFPIFKFRWISKFQN